MHYKTLMLALLQEEAPRLLQSSGTPLLTLERYATLLKDRHTSWMQALSQQRPGSYPRQMASQALELAIQDLRDALPAESPTNAAEAEETLSLDAAMASLRRPTPPA